MKGGVDSGPGASRRGAGTRGSDGGWRVVKAAVRLDHQRDWGAEKPRKPDGRTADGCGRGGDSVSPGQANWGRGRGQSLEGGEAGRAGPGKG